MAPTVRPTQETLKDAPKHILCWQSVLAGLLIAIMGFFLLATVGAGVAGVSAEALIRAQEGGMGFATAAGLWLGLSTVIALFCGSYFALRLSRHVTPKAGAAHAFVLGSIFYLLLFVGAGSMVGGAAGALSEALRGAGAGVSSLAGNTTLQDIVNKAVGGNHLKSEVQEVTRGLLLRLGNGDLESAKNYLVYQTGQSPADVEAQTRELKAEFDSGVKTAAEKSARALADVSLTLLVVMLVGLVGALVGGRVGAHSNADRPLARVLSNARGSVVPYVIGWLFGVPISLLFLIAIVRSIF